jgi:hypothetical protein
MGKKLSANELQQHNDRLLEGKEDELVYLLKNLENQKLRLPLEDHSVVDWGVNLLKAKEKEIEQFMIIKSKDILDKFQNPQTPIIMAWGRFTLGNPQGENHLFHEFIHCINEAMNDCAPLDDNTLKSCIGHLVDHLNKLCKERNEHKLTEIILKKASQYYKKDAEQYGDQMPENQKEVCRRRQIVSKNLKPRDKIFGLI